MASKGPPSNLLADMDALMAKNSNVKLASNKPATGTATAGGVGATKYTTEKKPMPDFNIFDPVKPKGAAVPTSTTAGSTTSTAAAVKPNNSKPAMPDFDIFEPPKSKTLSTASPSRPAASTASITSPSKQANPNPSDIFSIPSIGTNTSAQIDKDRIAETTSSTKPSVAPIDNASLDFLLGIGNKPAAATTTTTTKTTKSSNNTGAVKTVTPAVPRFDDIIQVAAVPVSRHDDISRSVEVSAEIFNPPKKPPPPPASFDLLDDDLSETHDANSQVDFFGTAHHPAYPAVPKVKSGEDFDLDMDMAIIGGNSRTAGANNQAKASSFDLFDGDTQPAVKHTSKATEKPLKAKSKAPQAVSSFDLFGDETSVASSNDVHRPQAKAAKSTNKPSTSKSSFDMFGGDDDFCNDDEDLIEAPIQAPPARKTGGGGGGGKKATVSSFDMFAGDDQDVEQPTRKYETDFDDSMDTKSKGVMQFGDDDDEVPTSRASNNNSSNNNAKVSKGKEKSNVEKYRKDYGVANNDVGDINDKFDEAFDDDYSNSNSNINSKMKSNGSSDQLTSGVGFGKKSASSNQSGNTNQGSSNQPPKKTFTKSEETAEVKDDEVSENLSPKYPTEGDILYRETSASIFLSKTWKCYYYVFQESDLLLFESKSDFDSSRGRNYKKCYPIVYNLKVNKPRAKAYGRETLYNFMMEEIRDYGPVVLCKFASGDKAEVENFFNQLVHVINIKRADYKASQSVKKSGF